jgi:hypothetical protein
MTTAQPSSDIGFAVGVLAPTRASQPTKLTWEEVGKLLPPDSLYSIFLKRCGNGN